MDEMTHAESARPATQGDLKATAMLLRGNIDAAVSMLRGEIKASADELRGEIKSTKDELRGEIMSAKDELRGEIMSAKDELRGEIMSAKDELRGEMKSVETRLTKIERSQHRMAVELVNTQAGLRGLCEKVDALPTKEDFNRLLKAVSSFAGKAQNYDRAAVLHGQALTELQVQGKDHEGRIKALESGKS